MPTSPRAFLASYATAALVAVALGVVPPASAKGPPPLITVCGELRCVEIREPSFRRAPLTGALLSGGHIGPKAGCRAETHSVRVHWRGGDTTNDRRFLMVADRGLTAPRRARGNRPPRLWNQVFTWRRAALKLAARRAGPGTPLCQLTRQPRLLTGSLARPWLYPRASARSSAPSS